MVETLNNIILIGLIVVSMIFDVTKKRIPNFVTFPVIVWGLFSSILFNGWTGFVFSSIGFLVGLLIFLVPFALGGMGGGDVKMLAAVGALKGWQFVVYTALFAGLFGAVIVLILLIKQRKLGITIKRLLGFIFRPILFLLTLTFNSEWLKKVNKTILRQERVWEKQYIPYGVAIGLGALLSTVI